MSGMWFAWVCDREGLDSHAIIVLLVPETAG